MRGKSRRALPEPDVYTSHQHTIDEALIDSDALHVIAKLREAGYLAYIVGGGVRDLLMGVAPKDFDVSTSALPEEVKRLFGRSCLLIGRRFRLAHVRFGHKVIEVATFRSGENDSDLIVRDNRWGTPEEDALRRDFTINGLCYDPETHSVIDYTGGWADLKRHLLRTIGDPYIRFKQDPVRMIRLIKFQARFGFNIYPETKEALSACRHEIIKSAPARILEEMLRMLESGAATPFFKLLVENDILELLFPCLDHFLRGPHAGKVYELLASADGYQKKEKKFLFDRTVLSACLVFPILEEEIKIITSQKGPPHIGEITMLANALIQAIFVASFSNFPRRMSTVLSFILSTQYRFTPLTGKRHHRIKLLQCKEMNYALQFFKLRSLVDTALADEYHSWYQLFRQHEKRPLHHHVPRGEKGRPREPS